MMKRSFTYICLIIYCAIISFISAKNQDPKCLLPMESGPCRMNLERYYYNSKTNTCEVFKFGGCRGNDNKFGFRKTCEDACLQISTTLMQKDPISPIRAVTSSSTVKPKTSRKNN